MQLLQKTALAPRKLLYNVQDCLHMPLEGCFAVALAGGRPSEELRSDVTCSMLDRTENKTADATRPTPSRHGRGTSKHQYWYWYW